MSTAPAQYREPSRKGLRLAIFGLAAALALQALWVLTPELTLLAGPLIAVDSAVVPTARNSVCVAARLALVRGDLWTKCALVEQPFQTGQSTASLERAHAAAERAAVFAPQDSMNWLILANLNSRLDRLTRKAAASLKMSYYTGPNEAPLTPIRLRVAARVESLADEEVQRLVRHEIRTIITRRPELKSSISAAYGDAPPEGKRFFELAVGELDPNLPTWLRSGMEHR